MTTRKDDDFSSSSFADRRHRDDARYGREKKRTGRTRWRRKTTRASEGTTDTDGAFARVFMNREKTRLERLDIPTTKIKRERGNTKRRTALGATPQDDRRSRFRETVALYTRRGDESSFGRLAFCCCCCCSCCCCSCSLHLFINFYYSKT